MEVHTANRFSVCNIFPFYLLFIEFFGFFTVFFLAISSLSALPMSTNIICEAERNLARVYVGCWIVVFSNSPRLPRCSSLLRTFGKQFRPEHLQLRALEGRLPLTIVVISGAQRIRGPSADPRGVGRCNDPGFRWVGLSLRRAAVQVFQRGPWPFHSYYLNPGHLYQMGERLTSINLPFCVFRGSWDYPGARLGR